MFVILDHFLPIFPLTTPKIKIFKKVRKNTWRYYHFTNVYHEWQYDLWFLRYGEYFVILDHFLSFCSPNNLKNQNFDKMKKLPGGTIILHMCIINDNHMMYGSWDMEHNRQKWQSYDVWFLKCGVQQTEFFFILNRFLRFYPLTNQKIKTFEKMKEKNTRTYYHFTYMYNKWQSYDAWFLRYGERQTEFFVILDHFLPF